MGAERIQFTCLDKAMARRIERAAQVAGKSVDAFVASAVAGTVDSYEETMVVHPQTGAVLLEDRNDVFTRVSHELTAPPKNGSNINFLISPQREAGKQFVRLEAWLTPEELVQMHHCNYNRDASRLPYLQLPIPAESEPRLTVDGKEALLDLAPPEALPMAMNGGEGHQ